MATNGIAKRKLLRIAAAVLLICSGTVASAALGLGQNQDQDQSQDQSQRQADKSAHSTQAPEKPEVKITPREAEKLFHSVDEILAFDSKQTGLPIKKQVKRRLTSRDEVETYLTKHLKDEDVKRLQRSELVL